MKSKHVIYLTIALVCSVVSALANAEVNIINKAVDLTSTALFTKPVTQLATQPLPNGTQEATVEFWFKTPNANTELFYLVGANSLKRLTANLTTQTIEIKTDSVPSKLTNDSQLAINSWHHLALSFEALANKNILVSLYLNGQFKQAYTLENAVNQDYFSQSSVVFSSASYTQVRVWDRVRSEKSISQHYQTVLSGNEQGMIAHSYFDVTHDNQFYSLSNNEQTLSYKTVLANAQLHNLDSSGYTDSPTGQALVLRTKDQGVDLPNLPAEVFDDGFTIEFWVKLNEHYSDWDNRIVDIATSHNDNTLLFSLDDHGGHIPVFYIINSPGSYDNRISAKNALPLGKWIHVAFTYEPTTTTGKLYFDGVLNVTKSNLIAPDANLIRKYSYIGNSEFHNNQNADVDEFRLWKTVRTAQQINDNKSKLIDTNPDKLVLYYDFDNNLTNKVFTPLTSAVNSYTANHKTIVDFPGINQAPGYGLQFDGTASSKVAYKTNTDVTYANLLDDKSFTVEFWARNKLDKTATNVNPVFAVKGVDETNSVLIALNNSDITCGTRQNTADTVSASLEVNSRPWLHIACVYNHSEQTLTLYKNGLQVGKQSSVAAASATGEVVVGGNGFGQYFTGELDELRVWQTALTQQQLRSDKNNRIVTNSEHLALYHSFEQAIKIIPDTQFHFVDLINDNKLYSASADTIFTDLNYAPPLHNIDVDGNVIVNRLHSLRFSADKTKFASPVVAESLKNVSEFTLSMWVNFNDNTSSQEFIVGNKEFKLVREVSGSVSLFVAGNPSAIITSSSVININSWQQLALVYSNDVFALYINNTQVGTVADEKPTDFNINEITFGADKQEASTLAALAASIDNIQLWGLGLSAEQVAKYSNATFNGAEANLLVYQTVNQLTLNNDKNIVLDGWQVTGLTLSNVDDNYPLSELTDQQSLYFDGVDDYILTSTHTLDVTNGISIALWSRAATLNNATTLLSHSDDSDSLQLGFTSNKQLTCSLNNLELVSSQAIVENEWFHWGCTFSIQNSELVLSLFKNGDMVDTKKFDQTSNYQVSAKVRLGGDNSRFYHGWVDELSVWSQALTQGDVNALQNATPTSNSTGLISYQDFNNELINQSVLESGGSEQLTYAQGIEYVYAPIEIGATLATGKLKTGLWQGQAVINKVNESHIEVTADNVVTPTKTDSTFLLPFLLHSSLNSTQMLSEVTIMQTKDNGVNPVQKILITDQSLLSNYDGVIRRNGKLTGVRLTALPFGLNCPIAAIHTDSTTGTQSCNYLNTKQTMSGGIYEGGRADIDIRYQEFHPLNPYRHKYHPDLAEGFVINRRISFVVDAYNSEQKKADPQLGVSKLTGTYLEQVTGLHNQTKTDVSSNIVLAPIVSKGTFIMQLVSDIKTLDTLEIAK